jgi:hypothetical protein
LVAFSPAARPDFLGWHPGIFRDFSAREHRFKIQLWEVKNYGGKNILPKM